MKNRYKLWSSFAVTLAVVTLTMIYLAGFENTAEPEPVADIDEGLSLELLEPRDDDWMKGNPDADVVIVKYSDFQCPACRGYAAMDDMMSSRMEEEALFIFRHFPLRNFRHSNTAALYVEAAGRQGKFWELHDLIYINQQRWSGGDAEEIFNSLAQSLELDMDQLQADMENPELQERIDRHYQSGQQLRVRAVPTIFINGEQIQLPRSIEEYEALINTYR
ncbi:DsbA family protein [Balneolaceae bacterium ANBcel3]|nr:DsbA family protein [Balneolaceae bacterium ANBcel3]